MTVPIEKYNDLQMRHDKLLGIVNAVEGKLSELHPQEKIIEKSGEEKVLAFVSVEHGVSIEKILSRNRSKEVASARAMVAYLLYETGNYSYVGIGRILGRTHATVTHALGKIQDKIFFKDKKILAVLAKWNNDELAKK